jgi:hypothetical protein
MADDMILLHTLLHRRTAISEEWDVAVETSLYKSNVTGLYVLEQVQHGRHETVKTTVSLSAEMIVDLLPLLTTIARDEGDETKTGPSPC